MSFLTNLKPGIKYSIENIFKNCGKYYIKYEEAGTCECYVKNTCVYFETFNEMEDEFIKTISEKAKYLR